MATSNQVIVWSGCAVISVVAGFFAYQHWAGTPSLPTTPNVPVALTPATDAVEIQHPVPAPAVEPALPALDDSDALLQNELISLLGQSFVQDHLLPQSFTRHLVATIDNLPRQKATGKLNPVLPMSGQIGDTTIAELNLGPAQFLRYDAFVQRLVAIDAKQYVATYFRLYPLLQQAYRSLGYPNGYFNDRLIAVIDHLIATPYVTQPIALSGGPGIYQFADPALEALSVGQRTMLRIGPDNASQVRSKLKEIRELIATAPAKPAQ